MLFRVVGMLALLGAVGGFVTFLTLPRRYVGRATLAVKDSASVADAASRTLSPGFLSTFVTQSPHYAEFLDYTPVEEIVDEIRKDTVIEAEGPRTCAIRFTDDDRYSALATTQTLMEQLRRDLGDAKVKDPVEVGISGPGPALCTLEGMAAGLIAGLCVWFAAARKTAA